MGITIESYPLTPTALGTGIDGFLKHVPNLGAYVEYAANAGVFGFRMWNDRTLEKLTEWTTSHADMDLYANNYENWCFGPTTRKPFVVPLAGVMKLKRMTPVTLVAEAEFGSNNTRNNDNSMKTPGAVSATVDVYGVGYICALSITTGCIILKETDFDVVACSNTQPNFDGGPTSTMDFYGYVPHSTTGKPQWWLSLVSATYVTANVLSYEAGVVDAAGGENATVTELHRLDTADFDTFFQTNVGSDIRYVPCPDIGILLICATSSTGLHVVALSLADTTQVLWRASYANCDILGSNDLISTDYPNRPVTRGRYMALGEVVDDGVYSPETVYLIDLQTGTVLDSGSVGSIAVSSASPQRSFWNASTGDLIFVTGGASGALYRVRFDYDLSAGLSYGQDFDAPSNLIEGFRGTRLERSNVTGVINTFFEDLQDRLQSYVDAGGETYIQQALDMNNYKITNLPDAVNPDDLIPKEQAEALA